MGKGFGLRAPVWLSVPQCPETARFRVAGTCPHLQRRPGQAPVHQHTQGFRKLPQAGDRSDRLRGYGFWQAVGNVWEWCSDWFDLRPTTGMRRRRTRPVRSQGFCTCSAGGAICVMTPTATAPECGALPEYARVVHGQRWIQNGGSACNINTGPMTGAGTEHIPAGNVRLDVRSKGQRCPELTSLRPAPLHSHTWNAAGGFRG